MTGKPYYIKNFVSKELLKWKDIEKLIQSKNVETINKNQEKLNYDVKDKRKDSLIITGAKNYNLDFIKIFEYLLLKDNLKAKDWDVHVYVSYKDGKSFKKHNDQAINYIIQCQGKSRWIVENSFDVILDKGDLIYIPYEWYHQCIPLTKRISISIPIWN